MTSSRPLDLFHDVVREWFSGAFPSPTRPQRLGWPVIAGGESTLITAPTGTGKTLTAFLWCLNRLMFEPVPPVKERCRVIYVSPLKALAFDIERNLRGPLAGISALAAERGVAIHVPHIAIRTGDTPAAERARFQREPADILITTPESLFLLLTSNARERLVPVDTVIVDEIHSLVASKRGAHLALSLERLEVARQTSNPLQRIGLSATQRPLDEVARFLGGALPPQRRTEHKGAGPRDRRPAIAGDVEANIHAEFADERARTRYREVTIVDASGAKDIALRIEVPVEESDRSDRSGRSDRSDRSRSDRSDRAHGNPASIWSSIYPRLLELIQSHRSTLLFVNSRRLAERLAGALNELAGEPLVRSHHGSLAREARNEVEELLKAGEIRGLVATSSLELGIDMGAIDLVVQIEAPPSVASGLQRVGRAGHQVGAASEGIIFPKFRGDLLAAAAVAKAMHDGEVESTRYPRNPLDVLAQQIVAMAAMEPWDVDDLFARVRQAAPFAGLSRTTFESVLDMLSGRYPSDEFAELRPRVTWDRAHHTVIGREGAKRVAIANAGTIPDRGLYGVFLAGADRPTRVGELDEEMVFETEVGDTFTLGASTWRVEEITQDRVLVLPAPGEPGKMPFWHGDRAGRPVELGYAIGRLVRELRELSPAAGIGRLVERHDLDRTAAEHLLGYLNDQAASGAVPDDRTVVIERCLDDAGDWRVCLLSPLGSRIHAPWAMAVTAHIRQQTGMDVEVMWGDEGFVVRFPEVEVPPDTSLLLPDSDDVEGLVLRQLGGTSLFAARFRETAARALLLPRRRPGRRMPLWQQRKRAADLLAVAAKFGSFPALLETYREVLRDHFDMPALVDTLGRISTQTLKVAVIDSRTPSPFAASLLFNYVANYIYDGDAPLAERRAQALSVDQAQLRELLGDSELRELLDADAVIAIEHQLQHLDDRYRVRTADGLHDLLLRIGDLTLAELDARSALPDTAHAVDVLTRAGRIVELPVGGVRRLVAVEDVARFRDALGVEAPPGVPDTLLEPVRDPAGDLVMRYARSHGPFTSTDLAARFGLGRAIVEAILGRLAEQGTILEGEFRPGGTGREWIGADVLRNLRQRSLARLRREVEPVDGEALGRFLVAWHGVGTGRRGHEALLDAIEQLQGAPIAASLLEREILPARIDDYQPGMLDTLMAAGEVAWAGIEPLGGHDGRIALFLTDRLTDLRPASAPDEGLDERARNVLSYLRKHGASFFGAIHQGIGGGFPNDTVSALWDLVWKGLLTNDTLHPLRALVRTDESRPARRGHRPPFRSRRLAPPTAEGRWAPLETGAANSRSSTTARAAAVAGQLLARHGIVTRETMAAESLAGGFQVVYQVLKAMEDAGRVRRGYFVAHLGAAQFAMPSAVELLRSLRDASPTPRTAMLSATDPANPYGAVLPWPELSGPVDGRGPTRTVGARVVLVDGAAAAYLRRGESELILFAADAEPGRSGTIREVARALVRLATERQPERRGMLISDIDGAPAVSHAAADLFVAEGFTSSAMGLQLRAGGTRVAPSARGGMTIMAQPRDTDDLIDTPRPEDSDDLEQEHIRSSDEALEQEEEAPRERSSDEAVRGSLVEDDVDPDSAESGIDRDDMSND